VFLNNDEGTDQMFKQLKAIGVRLALDDFGTGYSSLGYLRSAPFDKIKIDQSFVRGATQPGSRNGAIIASIVSLAEALGMETTAEGVETLDELDLVRALGAATCRAISTNARFRRPMPPNVWPPGWSPWRKGRVRRAPAARRCCARWSNMAGTATTG
jgi:predicted signal transduction protein with EAL and GGDEF domain